MFVAVSIIETVSALATYAKVPSGVIATPVANDPTRTVATTVLVAVSITETVLPKAFAT